MYYTSSFQRENVELTRDRMSHRMTVIKSTTSYCRKINKNLRQYENHLFVGYTFCVRSFDSCNSSAYWFLWCLRVKCST